MGSSSLDMAAILHFWSDLVLIKIDHSREGGSGTYWSNTGKWPFFSFFSNWSYIYEFHLNRNNHLTKQGALKCNFLYTVHYCICFKLWVPMHWFFCARVLCILLIFNDFKCNKRVNCINENPWSPTKLQNYLNIVPFFGHRNKYI